MANINIYIYKYSTIAVSLGKLITLLINSEYVHVVEVSVHQSTNGTLPVI